MKLKSSLFISAFFLAAFAFLHAPLAAEKPQSLAGTWRFQLDRQDNGIRERWFSRKLPDKVKLPGSLPGQGIGDKVTMETPWIGGIADRSFFTAPEYEPYRQPGNIKVPFWLQPETHYAGIAWYQRDIEIPSKWQKQRVVLTLELPHWETRVWLDDTLIGTNRSLSTPHEYDLGTGLMPGKHTLTIRVDNRMVIDIGQNSHSVSDHTQGNWNGIVGRIELRATSTPWIEQLDVYPQVDRKSFKVAGKVNQSAGADGGRVVELTAEQLPSSNLRNNSSTSPKTVNVEWTKNTGEFAVELMLGDTAKFWDEFNPVLYRITAKLFCNNDVRSVTAGLRQFTTQGTQFLINGRPVFLRGTLDCCIYPKTGHPPIDVGSWKKVIRAAKAHGLNSIRFHSWCPPQAAFIVADELGFYLQPEAASWANQSTTLGDGKPVDQWIYDETDRILKAYGNHPSFVLMAYGNEPGGRKHGAYLSKYVNHYKAKDPRRLWTSGAGWPQLPENQWHSAPNPRIQAWGAGLKSRINARPPETITDYRDYIEARDVPVISHEIGQWCVYPNFDEMKKYTGYLKPRNFEIFRERLKAHGMFDQAKQFLLASGKLQTLCYKEDIESALRTHGMGGFQLLDLHDFPGQGTALVGVLDPFWEQKGYVTPAEYSRFCNSTVPLARWSQRVFTTEESLVADFEVAHYGPEPLAGISPVLKLVDDRGKTVANREFKTSTLPVGKVTKIGSAKMNLEHLPAPARYKVQVSLPGTQFENDWDIWVYPSKVDTQPPAKVVIAHDLDEQTLEALDQGGNVLLLLPPNRVKNAERNPVVLGFSSIFWNTAWTRRQAPTTLGVLCDPKHPMFASFPTDYHSNWQWWHLITRARAMILDELPGKLRPTLQVIDDWFTARKLGLVFEAKLSAGKLVVCSIDLERELDTNPVARQFRHSLLQYMTSKKFKPKSEVTAVQVRSLFSEPSVMQKHGARVHNTSSAEVGYKGEQAIDGNPGTMWHTQWTGNLPQFPHELVIEFEAPISIAGFTVLPRQDNNPNGWIKDYAFFVSTDGENWSEPAIKGTFPANGQLKKVMLPTTREGQFVRLVGLSGHAQGPWASLAEFEILLANE